MLKLASKIIASLEDKSLSMASLLFVFLFSVTTRNYLEILVYREIGLDDWYALMHYTVYYSAIFLAIILLHSLLLQTPILKAAKVIVSFSPVIIICPIVDYVAQTQFGVVQQLGYLGPEFDYGFWDNYLLFFGEHFGHKGPTPGYRTEVATVLLFFGIYQYVKSKKWWLTIVGFVSSYTIIYFFCSTPFILKGTGLFKTYSAQIVPYYLLLTLFFSLLAFAKHNKNACLSIFQDIRPARLAFYLLVFVLGAVNALQAGKSLYASNFYIGVFTLISISFAWMYSVMSNNLSDIEIDRISNKTRPLVSGKSFSESLYKQFMWISLAISIGFAWYAHFAILLHIILFIGNYYVYSNPPLRVKRIPLLSKFFIAFNVLILYSLGGTYLGYTIDNLDLYTVGYILIGGTLGLNVIDLKDVLGDKKAGIKTLPVLLGLQNAKYLMAAIFLGLYGFSGPFVSSWNTYYFLIVIGLLQAVLITRKSYSDRAVVWLFAFSIFLVALEPFVLK